MSIEQFFYDHPVFRLDELVGWRAKNNPTGPQAVHTQLQHHLKTGRLLRIRRELYAVVPPNQTAENISVDPYLIAGKVSPDSILSFHTALELFGIAYSAFDQFTYFSQHKTKAFGFQEHWFQPVALPKIFRNDSEIFFEIETINRQGVDLRVTSLARTFVDVLNRVDLGGGWEEVIRSINNMAALNIDRVIQYCLKLNNAILSAKVGYFLEQRHGVFSPTEQQILMLLQHKPSSPQYVSKIHTEACRLIKKWNVILPTRVIDQSWEEPDHDV